MSAWQSLAAGTADIPAACAERVHLMQGSAACLALLLGPHWG